jgi:hypothetical protein
MIATHAEEVAALVAQHVQRAEGNTEIDSSSRALT